MKNPSGSVAQGVQGAQDNVVAEALPYWQEGDELVTHKHHIFEYHTFLCSQFANGHCPRHRGSRAQGLAHQCFSYHFESQKRRQLVDPASGRLRYWDVLCQHVAEGEECPFGDACCFAHTREEISYHAAKYKTKSCNDRDCRGEDVCCFAHGENELRSHALERYSYWSFFNGGAFSAPVGIQGFSMPNDLYQVAAAQSMPFGNANGTLYHPKVYKHRFCASYPDISRCRRADGCAFAHSREEIRTPLLSSHEEDQRTAAMTNDFFMCKFKTLWCPIGVQHDWQTCVYAHNYQDARRHPGIGYGPRPCTYWKRKETSLEYAQRCPLGVQCPFSHGAKEQLYHPSYFKTVTCQESPKCPREKLCAFWHKKFQQRQRPIVDECDYKQPLGEGCLQALQSDFLNPPFKLLNNSLQAEPNGSQGQQHFLVNGFLDNGNTGLMDQSCLWTSQLCNYGSASPATPTTNADSDEAASADSSSDKPPSNEGYPSNDQGARRVWTKNANRGQRGVARQCDVQIPSFPDLSGCGGCGAWPNQMMMANMPWQQNPYGFMPGPNGIPQMMCYMQAEVPLGQQNGFGQESLSEDSCQMATPDASPQSSPRSRQVSSAGMMSPIMAPMMSPFWGPAGFSYPMTPMMGYPAGSYMGSAVPDAQDSQRFGSLEATSMMRMCTAPATTGSQPVAPRAVTSSTPGGPERSMLPRMVSEEVMPTYKGFIHFKEADAASDSEDEPVGRRRRTSSF